VQRPAPFVPVLLAWLVPGAGHLAIGRIWPGLVTFLAIVPLYVGGMALAGFENVSLERHEIYFWGAHVWGGALTAAAAWFTRHVELLQFMPYKSTGELFTAVACLLNVIALSDVWSRCRRGDPEERAEVQATKDEAASPEQPGVPSARQDAPPAAPEVAGG
jgi:uncharacterized protein DUF6677